MAADVMAWKLLHHDLGPELNRGASFPQTARTQCHGSSSEPDDRCERSSARRSQRRVFETSTAVPQYLHPFQLRPPEPGFLHAGTAATAGRRRKQGKRLGHAGLPCHARCEDADPALQYQRGRAGRGGRMPFRVDCRCRQHRKEPRSESN